MSLGKPEDVETYCKRLIDEVGQDGGFILSNGCSMPSDPKPENVRAMIQIAKNCECPRDDTACYLSIQVGETEPARSCHTVCESGMIW